MLDVSSALHDCTSPRDNQAEPNQTASPVLISQDLVSRAHTFDTIIENDPDPVPAAGHESSEPVEEPVDESKIARGVNGKILVVSHDIETSSTVIEELAHETAADIEQVVTEQQPRDIVVQELVQAGNKEFTERGETHLQSDDTTLTGEAVETKSGSDCRSELLSDSEPAPVIQQPIQQCSAGDSASDFERADPSHGDPAPPRLPMLSEIEVVAHSEPDEPESDELFDGTLSHKRARDQNALTSKVEPTTSKKSRKMNEANEAATFTAVRDLKSVSFKLRSVAAVFNDSPGCKDGTDYEARARLVLEWYRALKPSLQWIANEGCYEQLTPDLLLACNQGLIDVCTTWRDLKEGDELENLPSLLEQVR